MMVSRSIAWATALRIASSFVGGCETCDVLRIGDNDRIGCPGLDLDELDAGLGDNLDLDGIKQGRATPVVFISDVPDQTPRYVRVKLEWTGPDRRIAVVLAQFFVGRRADLGRAPLRQPQVGEVRPDLPQNDLDIEIVDHVDALDRFVVAI